MNLHLNDSSNKHFHKRAPAGIESNTQVHVLGKDVRVRIHPRGRHQQEPWDVLVIKSFKLRPLAYRKVPIKEMKCLKKH